MKFKKMLSGIAAMAIAASAFAGLGAVAMAADDATTLLSEDFELGEGETTVDTVFGEYTPTKTLTSGEPIVYQSELVNYNNALSISNATATATFTGDGYTINKGEQITIEYDSFHGWMNEGTDNTYILKNSNGEEILSYAYNWTQCGVTWVKIGDEEYRPGENEKKLFVYQSVTSDTKHSNGWTAKNQSYTGTDGWNPHTTITINGDGYVEIKFELAYDNVSQTYSATLPETVAMNIGSFEINHVLTGRNPAERATGLDNLVITKSAQEATMVEYTVNYVCEGAEKPVLIETKTGSENTAPVVNRDSFFNADGTIKYIYVSDGFEDGATISETTNVFTVNVREAAICNPKVIGRVGNTDITLVEATNTFEGETVNYNFSAYLTENGSNKVIGRHDMKDYVDGSGNTARNYKGSFVAKQGTDEIVEYNEYTGTAYFIEAEDVIKGGTVFPGGTDLGPERVSGGAGIRTISDKDYDVFTIQEDGIYKVTACGLTRNVNKGSGMYVYRSYTNSEGTAENQQLLSMNLNDKSINKIVTTTSAAVEFNEGDKITVKGYEDNSIIDYILVEEVEPIEIMDGTAKDVELKNQEVTSVETGEKMTVSGTAYTIWYKLNGVAAETQPEITLKSADGTTVNETATITEAEVGTDGYYCVQILDDENLAAGEYTVTLSVDGYTSAPVTFTAE